MGVQDFIETYSPWAQQVSRETGVPASLILAQAALESRWGQSGLTKNANNFFGIKASSSWSGEQYHVPTQEYVNGKSVTVMASFRKYASPFESFMDWAKTITSSSRYKGVVGADPHTGAQLLQKGGYATDPNYAKKLTSIIDQYGLTKLDGENIPKPGNGSGNSGSRDPGKDWVYDPGPSSSYVGDVPLLAHVVRFIILLVLLLFVLFTVLKMLDVSIPLPVKGGN
ncbi:muramidase (flagellum-specific) [Brevibacillus sp. CF112]|uniref:glycoside hydrolase family 73 protein n=1 Tax=Brevibacillus sp. CF112 TaxID=1144311 RepID=UPI000271880B|nr:glycoside hydrolase family 73 protein [Brevibacillus sp. CF112]EJL42496.1 muramidase (flagellum-specific) [Brevibacillus sp. CF112]